VDLITGFIRGGAVLVAVALVLVGAEFQSIYPIIAGVLVIVLFSTDRL
jgi:hypothetical protein